METVLAVRQSLSDPNWENPTTQCLGAAKALAERIIIAADNAIRTFFSFRMEPPMFFEFHYRK
jgi:hypothetical protein